MKKLLLSFLFILSIFSSCERVRSQVTLDSAQVSKLIIKLNEREYLLQKDSLTSIELSKYDSLVVNLETVNGNLETIITNKDQTITELRQSLARIEESSLKWFHYAGGGVLVMVIGVLTGLLIK